MKLSYKFFFGLVAAMAIAPFLMSEVGSVQAQSSCKSFRAITQASLPTSTRLLATDVWGGPLYASLDGERLFGIVSGNDGDVVWHGVNGRGTGGRYTVGFGCQPLVPGGTDYTCTGADTFTIAISHSVFPSPPGMEGFGNDHANTATIVEGTGRFEFATGNLNFGGPYVIWALPGGTPPVAGRFNGEMSGMICGIE